MTTKGGRRAEANGSGSACQSPTWMGGLLTWHPSSALEGIGEGVHFRVFIFRTMNSIMQILWLECALRKRAFYSLRKFVPSRPSWGPQPIVPSLVFLCSFPTFQPLYAFSSLRTRWDVILYGIL